LKVLWFAHRDIKHPKSGGAERTIYEVGRRLAAKGMEFHLVTVNPGNLLEYENVDGIITHRIRGNVKVHLAAHRMVRSIDPDIIVDDLGHAVPWFSSWFSGKKVIVFFRHLHARSLPGQVNFLLAKSLTLMERAYPMIYRKNTFVTESSTSESDLVNLGIRKERIMRIPPGVDLELFHPGKKTEFPQLVYFGGLRRYKRPEYSVKVYELLKDEVKDLKMVIVGDGPMLKEIREEVDGKNYNIEFPGRISNEELARVVRESWVNIHFSVTEGWGLSIIESSASGTPTVGFKVPGVVDTVRDGYNGFLVNSIKEFKSRILDIIEKEDEFSANSRKFAENFSWDKTANLWFKLLNNS
jgi:glycosyltransferase involved in cell wall biosynthesis